MQKIAVIGAGYVGLVTAAALAETGNKVLCVDSDTEKIRKLKNGAIPIYEPGLEKIILKNKNLKRLLFSTNIKEATVSAQIIFICVGTPSRHDGSADLSAVQKVAQEIARNMKEYKVIVEKSTVPAETGEKIKHTIEMNNPGGVAFDVVSNPEFLREGSAMHDAFHPDRIVIGVESERAEKIMRQLYKPFKAPIVATNINTAELIKHACNSFLATKISFINAISNICERVNADVEKVALAMGLDTRIGKEFLQAGIGFGGSCFPKDVDAFIYLAAQKGYDFELLKAARKINQERKDVLLKKIEEALWIIKDKTIGVLGLSFKPDTDDIRSSVAIDIIKLLLYAGAKVKAYDPKAMEKARSQLKGVIFCANPYEVARKSDCVAILTEWQEFRELDLKKIKKLLRQPVIIDGRNMFEPQQMHAMGFVYKSIGRRRK
ncbi:MAG: UDP-glucose/GDP-mannose dehydrogenase family protein [Candidatus Omnitrophota bacterium]|jgi:UDPglucose 6-dehydrogenase|nr:MAG: UDP-glucose/GDP-mannose dehydrogenase family protein [Candidatus Omnitrophota bacterium]